MIKICIDARMIYESGIGTVIQNFLANFKEDFLLLVIGDEKKIKPYLRNTGNYRIIQTEIPIYSVREQLTLPLLIPRCDLFWSPHYNIPLFFIRAKKRVVTIHDVFHLAFSKSLSLPKKLFSAFLLSQAYKRSDEVITVSSFSRGEITKYLGYREQSVSVIPCGLDHELFRVIKNTESLKMIQVKYNLPSKYILYVGNVKPHKNLRNLVLAFSSLGQAVDGYKLIIVGKREGFRTGDALLINEIENDPFLRDNVHFTGFVQTVDLPYLYNLATLFVFPSLYEGFGFPPLEAMACGCPVLASKAASIPEICGSYVKYFDPTNVEDIASNIVKSLIAKDRDQFVEKGLTYVKEFLWTDYYDTQISLFKRSINRFRS
jgi:glycosyltransferase involved in cell wall biosynthesis